MKKSKTVKKNKSYQYTECGLDNVWLMNGFTIGKDGNVRIHSILELHNAIGMALINKNSILNGKEIRFIRHHMDLSQKTFGERFGVSYQSVLGWEQNKTLTETMDKFIKTTYFSFLSRGSNKAVYDFFTELAEIDAQEHDNKKINFKEINNTWDLAA